VYELRATPATDPRDQRSHRVLHVGTQTHLWVQEALMADLGVLGEIQVEVSVDISDLNLVGHADAVLQVASDGHWEMLEVKSISSRGFAYAKELPKPDHMTQAHCYAYGLIRDGYPIDRIRYVYISKDDLEVFESVEMVDADALEVEVKALIEELEPYREGDALPPRLPLNDKGKRNWLCGYCPFQTRCWDQDEAYNADHF
jgi:CRISPR/Cas system-associated exonuclease Cas4 (RecB family)